MADNYLERHMEEYEARKRQWEQKRHRSTRLSRQVEEPEDEAL
jgi:hypothetical protein